MERKKVIKINLKKVTLNRDYEDFYIFWWDIDD